MDVQQIVAPIPSDFIGLSYETKQLLPDEKGHYYFTAENKPLIALFRTLGVKSLRMGGNSVDTASVPVPAEADLDNLFAFAKAAGVKVIYSVRLKDGDPASAAAIARHLHAHYADLVECFAIGNEPGYYKPYDVYRPKWMEIMTAIVAVFPEAKFCGPDDNVNPELCRNLVRDFGLPHGRLTTITQHNYPAGCAYQNPKLTTPIKDLIPVSAVMAREKLLSGELTSTYEKVQKSMADAVAGTALTFRLSETNSLWYGGLEGASDSHASALWGVEYLYWWLGHGAAGLNFHTGDRVGGGDRAVPCRYATFVTAESGYEIRPLSYAMKLFSLGAQGKLISIVGSQTPDPLLAAFATIDQDQTVAVTLINKAHGQDAKPTDVRIALKTPSTANDAQALFLTAPQGDIAATSGLTLGGEAIRTDGGWHGKMTPLTVSADGSVTLSLPPASAVLVKMRTR